MAGAIIGGILEKKICKPSDIYVTDLNSEILSTYKNDGINAGTEQDVALCGDIVIFAVKPFILPDVLTELSKKADKIKDKIFASIVAGFSLGKIKEGLGFDAKVVRIMPNTPALIGQGMSVLATEYQPATKEEFSLVKNIFDAIGKTEVLPERLMSAVTSVSGSGPAYVYMMIEAMADAGVKGGLSREASYLLSAQTVLGAADMVLKTGIHPGELKDKVCSPAGTTIEAVAALEEAGFRNAIISAIDVCRKKAENL